MPRSRVAYPMLAVLAAARDPPSARPGAGSTVRRENNPAPPGLQGRDIPIEGSPGKVAEVPPGLADAYLVSSGRYRRCQLPRRAVAATGPGARSVVRPNARPGVADVRLSLLFCLSTQTLRLLPQWQAANGALLPGTRVIWFWI